MNVYVEHRRADANGIPVSEYRARIGAPVGPWHRSEDAAQNDLRALVDGQFPAPLIPWNGQY